MEVQTSQIIDVSLTAAELLVAGLLGVVVYSWLFGRRRVDVQMPEAQLDSPIPSTLAASPRDVFEGPRSIQFVSFAPKDEARLGGIRDSLVEARRRNRADVIRQARQMIETGAANREISSRLRLTEGELALLRNEINR